MRVWRGVLVTVAFVLVCLLAALAASCAPGEARADVKPGELRVAAAGDTLRPTFHYRLTGNPDSVACVFSGGGSATSRRVAAGASTACGPGQLIPVPAVVEGDSALIAVNWTLYKRNAPNVTGGPVTKWYKRPVTVPGLTPDSLTITHLHIIRDPTHSGVQSATFGIAVQLGRSFTLCPMFRFKDNGKWAMRDQERADTTCTRTYATTVGQLQRLQSATYSAATGTWVVGPASPARQAVLNGICLDYTTTCPDCTANDAACQSQGAVPVRAPLMVARR